MARRKKGEQTRPRQPKKVPAKAPAEQPKKPDPIDHDYLENLTKLHSVKKAKMIQSLSNTLQNVSASAKIVGISRELHYHWMKTDPVYAQLYEDSFNVAVNHVELQLSKQINKGNMAAITFWLRMKGRNHGYSERLEVEHSGSIRAKIEQMTDAEFAAYVEELEAKYLGKPSDTEQA